MKNFNTGGQTGQVKRKSPDQRSRVSILRWNQFSRSQFRQHKVIERITWPIGVCFRSVLRLRRNVRPKGIVPGALLDPPRQHFDRCFDVAVVGAGPAGLTCGHYLARLGYEVDIMDKAKGPGGMLTQAVPAFRLPEEMVEREIDGLTLPGMSFEYGKALGKDFSVTDLEANYNAVFLAPGLWSGRTINIAGLEKSKMTDGLSFLQSCRGNGKGKVGKDVVVIGGGSVASDAAVSAKHCGAKKVTLVCLESAEEMPCLQTEIDEMKTHGIKIENGWGPKAAPSKTKLSFVGCKAVFDKGGAFSPVFDESKTMELGFDQVILAVGQQTEPALAKYLKKEFGREDRVEVDTQTMQVVGRSAVFAGGDIVRGAGTVVEAVGDGRNAAAAIDALFEE